MKTKMSKITTALLIVIVSLCMFEKVQADEINRSHQFGIGADSGGAGVRYWFSDKTAIDGHVKLQYSDYNGSQNQKNYGGGLSGIFVLKKKGYLRLEGILGLNLSGTISKDSHQSNPYSYESIYTSKTTALDLGVGAEYSFQELPDLSFGAFLTGVGVSSTKAERVYKVNGVQYASENNAGKEFTTSPRAQLSVRYYF